MAYPDTCPVCGSHYPTIHALVYDGTHTVGVRCEDVWHRGADYNPSHLTLSEADVAFLRAQKVSPT